MSGCPGSRDGGHTPVFAPWALTPDDESLWEWQLEHRLAPFWRELCAWAAEGAPGGTICLELHPGASAYSPGSYLRLAERAGPNLGVNFDPSHFWWQGIDPFSVIDDVGTGHDVAAWAELLGALRAAGYDGDVSIEHEDPRMGPEEGIETSLEALRAALPRPEVPVG